MNVVAGSIPGPQQKQVAVVGTDGIREAKRSVGAGEMRATVAEFSYDEGVLRVQLDLRLLGCQAIRPWVVSPEAVITHPAYKTKVITDSPEGEMQIPTVNSKSTLMKILLRRAEVRFVHHRDRWPLAKSQSTTRDPLALGVGLVSYMNQNQHNRRNMQNI